MRRRAAALAAALSAVLLLGPVATAVASPAPAAAVLRTAVTPDPVWKPIARSYLSTVTSGVQSARIKAGAKLLVKDVAGNAALMRAYSQKDTA